MAKSKLAEVNEKIAEGVTGGYKKIEKGAVEWFNKIADKFVDNFLAKVYRKYLSGCNQKKEWAG